MSYRQAHHYHGVHNTHLLLLNIIYSEDEARVWSPKLLRLVLYILSSQQRLPYTCPDMARYPRRVLMQDTLPTYTMHWKANPGSLGFRLPRLAL